MPSVAKSVWSDFDEQVKNEISKRKGTDLELDGAQGLKLAEQEVVANFIAQEVFKDGVPEKFVENAPAFSRAMADLLSDVRDTVLDDKVSKAERALRRALDDKNKTVAEDGNWVRYSASAILDDGTEETIVLEHDFDFEGVDPATTEEAKSLPIDDKRNVLRFWNECKDALSRTKKVYRPYTGWQAV